MSAVRPATWAGRCGLRPAPTRGHWQARARIVARVNDHARVAPPSSEGSSPASPPRLNLLTRISAVVELQAAVQKFELLAARSAMLGVLFTAIIELGGSRVIAMDVEQGKIFAAWALLSITAAATVACMRRRGRGGRLLLEAVVTSLTCTQRSASSLNAITPSGLDESLDLVMDSAFNETVTKRLTATHLVSLAPSDESASK